MLEPITSITENDVPIAVEDRFFLIGVRSADTLCPSSDDAYWLGTSIRLLRDTERDYTVIVDVRGLPDTYVDVTRFICDMQLDESSVLLVDQNSASIIADSPLLSGYAKMTAEGAMHPMRSLDLLSHETDYLGVMRDAASALGILADGARTLRSFQQRASLRAVHAELEQGLSKYPRGSDIAHRMAQIFCGATKTIYSAWRDARALYRRDPQIYDGREDIDAIEDYLRVAYLAASIDLIQEYSLLSQFAMSLDGDRIVCVPMHGRGVHEVDHGRGQSGVVVARPNVIAHRTRAVFDEEIRELEALLNTRCVQEHAVQRFLERHPNFLKGLGYEHVYPQVVLSREHKGALHPDFVLEPARGEWCDILDLKLPNAKLVVGGRDRMAMGAAITQVAAQLREYGSYFEQEKYQKLVKERYGLSIYRPRLIAVVGRDPKVTDDQQYRRALTQYPDLRVITFDQLVRHARNHVLL